MIIDIDENVSRGPRPNANTIANFKSILCLESGIYEVLSGNVYNEVDICFVYKVPFYGLALNLITPPTKYQLSKALLYIESLKKPVYVHCKAGVDRTGAVIAAYRVAKMGWSVDDAMKEMLDHGFHWFYWWWLPFIKTSLKKLKAGV